MEKNRSIWHWQLRKEVKHSVCKSNIPFQSLELLPFLSSHVYFLSIFLYRVWPSLSPLWFCSFLVKIRSCVNIVGKLYNFNITLIWNQPIILLIDGKLSIVHIVKLQLGECNNACGSQVWNCSDTSNFLQLPPTSKLGLVCGKAENIPVEYNRWVNCTGVLHV